MLWFAGWISDPTHWRFVKLINVQTIPQPLAIVENYGQNYGQGTQPLG